MKWAEVFSKEDRLFSHKAMYLQASLKNKNVESSFLQQRRLATHLITNLKYDPEGMGISHEMSYGSVPPLVLLFYKNRQREKTSLIGQHVCSSQ